MSVLGTIGGHISEFFSETQSHQANSHILFWRVELADEAGPTRAEYNERALHLQQDLTNALIETGEFASVHLDQTIDPYIALGTGVPELGLSDHDENIYDLAEKAKQRHPWPDGTEYEIEDLLAGVSTPEAAQSEAENVVTYEVSVKGTYRPSGGGSPAALENARRVMTEFAAETADVKSIERFRPVEDGWYSFRYHNHEIRVRALPDAEPPNIEWRVGYQEECPRGVGWVDFVDMEPSGNPVGRLHLDKRSNEAANGYFDDQRHSILMPASVAEELTEDARSSE